jgi:hypothetical protein
MDEIEEIRKRFPLTREGILFHSHHLLVIVVCADCLIGHWSMQMNMINA